jgi:hypothetical protein
MGGGRDLIVSILDAQQIDDNDEKEHRTDDAECTCKTSETCPRRLRSHYWVVDTDVIFGTRVYVTCEDWTVDFHVYIFGVPKYQFCW